MKVNINFIEYVNAEDALARLGGNKTLYGSLIQKFKDDGYFTVIENAFKSGDEKEISYQIHALKGVSANLSLTKITSCCIEIEGCMRDGLDYTDSKNELMIAIGETEKVIDYHILNETFIDK
jgi:HPt (histidine-containing phosphotransfer) domain-containing protein